LTYREETSLEKAQKRSKNDQLFPSLHKRHANHDDSEAHANEGEPDLATELLEYDVGRVFEENVWNKEDQSNDAKFRPEKNDTT
jgi:hypothetical protein